MKNYKKYTNLSVLAIFSLMVFLSGTAIAGKMLPYESSGVASLLAEPVPGELVSGIDTGEASYLGSYHSILDLMVLPVAEDGVVQGIRFVGPTTIYSENGVEVHSILDVELDLASNTMTGTFIVIGGTGPWQGASGGGVLIGAVNADGTFSYQTEGFISRPRKFGTQKDGKWDHKKDHSKKDENGMRNFSDSGKESEKH